MFITLTVNISNMPPLQTADQKQAAERAAASLGFGGVDNARKVLGLDTLNTKPTQFNLPQQKQNTAGAGLQGMVQTQPKQNEAPVSTTADQSFADYMGALMGQNTETAATSQAYKEQGVNDLQKQLDSYDTQLEMEQNALRNKQKRIQDNSAGMSAQAIQDELNRAESESLWKQANISVVRAGVSRDFSRAKAIADSAVEMQMEQQKNTIEARKLAYERNQDLFDKAEQRAFDARIKDDERKYQEDRGNAQKIQDISLYAMQNGADGTLAMSILKSKSPEEAYKLAADFMSPLLVQQRNIENQSKQALANQRMGTGAQGSEMYANDMDALTGTVLATIPTKFGQQQFQAQISRARNDGDRLNIIASQVLKAQPAEVRRDFANQSVGITEIDKALKMIDDGVQTGAINNAAQYVYNIAGKDFDPKLAEINSHITAAIQPYRNSVTGAAWGTQEDQEYQALFGSTKYSPTELKQRLTTLKEILKSKSATTLNAFANPMGYGQNQFENGAYAPTTEPQSTDGSLSTFDSVMGTSESKGQEKGYGENLLNNAGNFIKAIFGY